MGELYEDMGISNLTEKRVKKMKESAVSNHRLQCDCVISFDNFDLLATDTNNQTAHQRKYVDKMR